MRQPGVWLHHANFPACFPNFAGTLIIKEVKENPSKTEYTLAFLFEQMTVTHFFLTESSFKILAGISELSLYNKTDSIGVESKITLF